MGKLHNAVHPYTFRGKLTGGLLIASVLAAVIALLFSYAISHLNMQEEVAQTEYGAALYIIELNQKTNLSIMEIFQIAASDELTYTLINPNRLGEDLCALLDERTLCTIQYTPFELPVTFVKLDDHYLSISASRDYNLSWLALFRIIFSASSFMLVFMALGSLVSYQMSRPISVLTHATRQIRDGDFTVRLPENVHGEIGELMQSFNSMTAELSRTAYLQKDFISSVSHEFRTPIASIRGYAHLLQMSGLTDEQRSEYVGYIASESDRLSRLSETLLRLTALEQQTGPASLSTFRLDEQVRQVILRLEPAWAAKEIDWQLDFSDVILESDEELLSHVWVNLISNAVKFSSAGSSIDIRVYQDDKARVEVTDHGPGMDEQTLERIFDRFYQADSSRSKEGVGLGLCLVKRILDMLGGEVTVCSTPGVGSTFLVSLPVKTPRAHTEAHHDS